MFVVFSPSGDSIWDMFRAHTRSSSNLSLHRNLYGSLIVLTRMAMDLLGVSLLAASEAELTESLKNSLA